MAMDVKELMMEKGDKIAVGAALLLLVGYAAYAFSPLSEDPSLKQLQDKVTASQAKLQNNPAPAQGKVDFTAMTSAWNADSIAKPAGSKSFVAMFKPKVSANVKGEVGPQPDKPVIKVIMAPVMGAAETELGQVKVKWVDGKIPPGEVAASIAEYELFRQEAGKGWASLAKVKARDYTDTSVEPKKKYAYKVKARTKDKTKDDKQETDFSQVVEATVPSGVAIIYTGGSPQAAAITVRKFMGGAWKEKKYTVLPKNEERNQSGDIGKIEKERDPDTNKLVEVDYRTNFVLVELKSDRFAYKKTERRQKIVDGQLVTEDVEVDADRGRMKAVYTNDEGKTVELWMAEQKEEEK
ncbi:MAG: hypothetical protein K8T20_09410 [Planctomycetes bacterium]|nr:hypothetical protein [Planctomycetota bacterium]